MWAKELVEVRGGVGGRRWCGRTPACQDALGFQGGDGNLYRYVGNDATNATDPTGLIKVTAKSVNWPQTGFIDEEFYLYWGVALYLDGAGLKELAKADPPGGYIVSKRKITYKLGDNKEITETRWHLNHIKMKDGKLLPNNDYSEDASGLGGARSMADGSTALTYFSVINNPSKRDGTPVGLTSKTGKITVEVTWKLYKGKPDLTNFSETGCKSPTLTIGADEYMHTRWTTYEPEIKEKPLAEGKIDASFTWTSPGSHTFNSLNKDITSGPDRAKRGKPVFKGWEYKGGKWVPR